MYRKLFLAGFLAITLTVSYAQEFSPKKGNFFASFGWNRSWYSTSNIEFKGDHYDFTLNEVKAYDRQTKFALDPYFHPVRFTVPQTNTKIGYFISDQFALTIGFDHMKYVMLIDQVTTIDGYIEGTDFDGTYNNDRITLDRDFMTFEHTDGLNYINVDIQRFDNLYALKKIEIQLVQALGLGLLNPRTNVKMFDKERADYFHLSGYGFHGFFGLKLTLFRVFFLQGNWQAGYINMPDIRTTNSKVDRAKQSFFYNQMAFVFGAHFNFKKSGANPNK